MTDVDELFRTELHRAYPPSLRKPDWDEVLARVPRPPMRARRRKLALAAVAVAAVCAAIAVTSIARKGPSFTDRALGAIGTDRYLRVVVEPAVAYASVVDLKTGRSRAVRRQWLYVIDSGSQDTIATFSSWVYADGVLISSAEQGNIAQEPGLASYLSGYRKALADGSAKVAGETTYRGHRAKIVRFSFDYAIAESPRNGLVTQVHYPGGASEDVAVDSSTYRPLWIRRSWTTLAGGRATHHRDQLYRIVSIESTAKPRRPPAVEPSIGQSRPALHQVTRAGAARVLGRRAVWPGTHVGPLAFRSVQLEQLFSRGGPPGDGLHLAYARGDQTLDVRESRTPQPSYSFSFRKLIPTPGKVRLTCSGCGAEPPEPEEWSGLLQKDGMFVSIKSASRDLVLLAARALTRMP